jgi:hypothetical protein
MQGWTDRKGGNMGKATAAERLQAALTEQRRLRELYEASMATSSETSSFVRLQAANLQVAMCERTLRIASPGQPA